MREMTEEQRAHLAGRRVVASVSGGKDSAALSLWLTENGIEHERVFLDTGWEHPSTYAYLREELTAKLGPISEVRGKLSIPAQERLHRMMEGDALSPRVRAAVEAGWLMVQLVLVRGMFPSRQRRFCTQELKVFPMQEYLASLDDDVVNCVGIRRAESQARSQMTEWEWSEGFDCEVWRPLVDASEQDVIDLHTRHGLRPNPLYLQGASRVGCWPCIYSRKNEIRFLADHDPERIALLRDLEDDVTRIASARYAQRGESFASFGYANPSWFQARTGKSGDLWPIDRVVEWSRTARGGRQFELFQPESEAGCVRWGLCETSAAESPR